MSTLFRALLWSSTRNFPHNSWKKEPPKNKVSVPQVPFWADGPTGGQLLWRAKVAPCSNYYHLISWRGPLMVANHASLLPSSADACLHEGRQITEYVGCCSQAVFCQVCKWAWACCIVQCEYQHMPGCYLAADKSQDSSNAEILSQFSPIFTPDHVSGTGSIVPLCDFLCSVSLSLPRWL